MVEALNSGVRRLDHRQIQRLLFQQDFDEATRTLRVLREAALETCFLFDPSIKEVISVHNSSARAAIAGAGGTYAKGAW